MSLARAQAEFLERVLASGAPSDAGTAVYHRTALAARCGALAAAYPVVRRLVGEAFFEAAARTFAVATPSTRGDLHAYGETFPAFLAAYEPARALEYLADVARLEWSVHQSHHAADGIAFDFAALGRVAPGDVGRVRIFLQASVRLVSSQHPILAIWSANQEGEDGTPDRTHGPDRVVVRRIGHRVAPILAGRAEFSLLEAFARGQPLAAAVAAIEPLEEPLAPVLARLAGIDALGGFDLVQRP